jgi:glycosyltransferase involved in cell wall biosynthesis
LTFVPTLLTVNNYHYARGGADAVALEHARLFEERGWQAVPFAMHHPQNEPSPWSDYFVDELELGSDYGLVGNATRAVRAIYSSQARRRLAALLEVVRPDVAHVHNLYHHISPSILPLLHDRGIPTLLTTHDLKLACPAYQMLTHDGICERCKDGRLRHVVANRCIKGSRVLSTIVFAESSLHRRLRSYEDNVDRFITPSRFYLDMFAAWGFDVDRFVHVPNHVDTRRFEPDPRPGRAFTYFGRLSPEKGIATLIEAAAIARVPLVIVGTGPAEAELRALAERRGGDVVFTGRLEGAALHARVRESRAVVLPSEWYENAPVSILEAYALGKPVVGARIGGIPELIREGETGECFESGSSDDLAATLGRIAKTPDNAVTDLGRCALEVVGQEFTRERYVERVLDVYASVGASVR